MTPVSQDIIEQTSIQQRNLELFLTHFPGVVSTGDNGELVINTDKLKLALDPKAHIEEKGYELNWVGKKEAYHQAYAKQAKILQPLEADSKLLNTGDFLSDNTQNILIKGDNLQALKLLKASYFEQIKLIYIDPPYNTKSENFIYRDNFTQSEDSLLDELGYNAEYKDYIKNIQSARTHSGWLSFMFPRLLVARDLLKEDGVIFISIDDNEQANLKLLCDEVFGEQNFVSSLVWEKKKKGTFLSNTITNVIESILVYSKNKSLFNGLIGEINSEVETYPCINSSNKREVRTIPAGIESKFRDQNFILKAGEEISDTTMTIKLLTDLIVENGFLKHDVVLESNWRYTQKNLTEFAADGCLYLTRDLYIRRIVKEDRHKTLKDLLPRVGDDPDKKYKDFNSKNLQEDGWGSNEDGEEEVRLFLAKDVFSNPKPSKLIKKLIASVRFEQEYVLDFFAGSGTTGQAVMELNAEDGGNRKFILVQLPEQIDQKKQATAYKFVTDTLQKTEATIFEITAERLRRAGEKIKKDHADKPHIADLDTGFKVYALADDPMQQFYKPLHQVTPEDLAQLEIALSAPTQETAYSTILVNLLLAEKLPLSTPVVTLIDKAVYQAANVLFIVADIAIEDLKVQLAQVKQPIEYVSIYSPSISGNRRDQFVQMLKPALSFMGLDESRLSFRG